MFYSLNEHKHKVLLKIIAVQYSILDNCIPNIVFTINCLIAGIISSKKLHFLRHHVYRLEWQKLCDQSSVDVKICNQNVLQTELAHSRIISV